MKKYTKEEILFAGEIGEVSMIDVRHVVSLLDEAREEIRKKKLKDLKDYCRTSQFPSDVETALELLKIKSAKKLKKILNKKLTT